MSSSRPRRLTLHTFTRGLVASLVAVWGLTMGIAQVAHSQTGPSPITPTTLVRAQGTYPTQVGGLISVLAMGSDNATGPASSGGGCDALHIITVNTGTKKGSIVNIPRDTYLQGHKITDICRGQGFDAGVQALRSYTGLPIQYYAFTNFLNFMQVMNEIGGLDIHVYTPLFNVADTGAHFNPGDYHMLGGDLLAFARERDSAPGGDFGRTTDQAQIILSGFNHFRSAAADMGYILDLIRFGRRHVVFNVPLTQLIQWGMIARQLTPQDFQSCTLLGQGQMINGADVEIPAASNQTIFHQVAIDGTIPGNAQCFQSPGGPSSGINWQIPPQD